VVKAVQQWPDARKLDSVECLWEPGMVLAARIREALGLKGLSVAQTLPFRDKERMKQVLDAAGLRTPRHVRCNTASESSPEALSTMSMRPPSAVTSGSALWAARSDSRAVL
jgi:hypothetical protein